MIHGLSHVAIAVPDLEAAKKEFLERYGLAAGGSHINSEQSVILAYIDTGNCRIELIAPLNSASSLNRFLSRNPKGGLHHISFFSDDIDATVGMIKANGGDSLSDGKEQKNYAGVRIAFVHPSTAGNTLIEIEEQHLPQGNILGG